MSNRGLPFGGLLHLAALLFAAAAPAAESFTVDPECPRYVREALHTSPLDWASNALRVLANPRGCDWTYTGRFRFWSPEYNDAGGRLLQPSRVKKLSQTAARMLELRVAVVCSRESGVSFQLDRDPEGSGAELLRIDLGSEYRQRSATNAPQEPPTIAVAAAIVTAALGPRGVPSSGLLDGPSVRPKPPRERERHTEAETVAYFLEEAWTEAVAGSSRSLVIIGRRADTEIARGCPMHVVLDDPRWTLCKNDEWVCDAVAENKTFYVGAQVRQDARLRTTILWRELTLIEEGGDYRRWGNYLVPPPGAAPSRAECLSRARILLPPYVPNCPSTYRTCPPCSESANAGPG